MKSLLFLTLIIGLNVKAQSPDDFAKLNYETEITEEGIKIEKRQFYVLDNGSYLINKTLLDNSENYLEQTKNINTGIYLNEYYFFFKETASLNRNTLSINSSDLLNNNFNNIVAILRYVKTQDGVDEYFSTLIQGQIDKLYVNGIEKSKI